MSDLRHSGTTLRQILLSLAVMLIVAGLLILAQLPLLG